MSLDLRKLWQLHEIDYAILEIRKRAAALDPGRAHQAKLAQLEQAQAEALKAFQTSHGEIQDLALRRKGYEEKSARLSKQLYGGSVVNPKEAETIEKEIHHLKAQIEEAELEELTRSEESGPLKKAAEAFDAQIAAVKKELAAHQVKARELQKTLESEFKRFSEKRGPTAKEVNPSMLARYEAIRQKQGGIGMVRDVKGRCSECGMALPQKSIETARDGRIVTCEACHRILYVTDGLV